MLALLLSLLAAAAEPPPGVCEPGWLLDAAGRCARQREEAGALVARAGSVWLDDGEGALLRALGAGADGPSRALERVALGTGEVTRLADLPEGSVWIAGTRARGLWTAGPGGVWRFDVVSGAWEARALPKPGLQVASLDAGIDGVAWLTDAGGRLAWRSEGGEWRRVKLPKGASFHVDALGSPYASGDGWRWLDGKRWRPIVDAEGAWRADLPGGGVLVQGETGWWSLRAPLPPSPVPAPPLPSEGFRIAGGPELWLIPDRGLPVGWRGGRWELGPLVEGDELAVVQGTWASVDAETGAARGVDEDGVSWPLASPGASVGARALAGARLEVFAPGTAGVASWVQGEDGAWTPQPAFGGPTAAVWVARAGARSWAMRVDVAGRGQAFTRLDGEGWVAVGAPRAIAEGGVLAATEAGALWVEPRLACLITPEEACKRVAGLTPRGGVSLVPISATQIVALGGVAPAPDVGEQTGAPAELVDLAQARASLLPPLPGDRSEAAATRLADGSVLVVGGKAAGRRGPVRQDAWRWSPAEPAWQPAGRTLGRARAGALVALPDGGALLVAGGGARTERFTAEGGWEEGPSLALGRSGATAALAPDGSVLVVGGRPEERGARPTAERLWLGEGPAIPWIGAVAPNAAEGLDAFIREGLAEGRVLEELLADPAAPKPDAAGELDGRRASCFAGRGADCVAVARALERGEGVPADPIEAARWRARACEAGVAASCAKGP